MDTQPPWLSESSKPFPSVDHDRNVDVLIVGGGVTGITAAYLLAQSGISVALLEKGRIGNGETGHTTAHITFPADRRLHTLVAELGNDHAQAVWDAGLVGQEQIAQNVHAEGIACELRRVPGYLFAAWGSDLEKERNLLEEDASLGHASGFDLAYVPLAPVVKQPAVRFSNVLKLHPLQYLRGLAKSAWEKGAEIHEDSAVTEFDEEKRLVKANGHTVRYGHLLMATHVPMQGNSGALAAALLNMKMAAYSTYAIRAQITEELSEALFWDTADPYLYLRIDRRRDEASTSVILGGEDHKTGQEAQTGDRYASLESKLKALWPKAQVDAHWSGQVMETVDGLPIIGEAAERQFVATGYSGTGFTYGTLAAVMFRDHIMGTPNPWTELFRVKRKPLSHAWDYMAENKDYPFYILKRLLSIEEKDAIDRLLCGEGKVIRCGGRKVAAFRGEDGKLSRLSAICPHMGCVVSWNEAERTWDCPCHGSRFTSAGALIAGPAESDLSPME